MLMAKKCAIIHSHASNTQAVPGRQNRRWVHYAQHHQLQEGALQEPRRQVVSRDSHLALPAHSGFQRSRAGRNVQQRTVRRRHSRWSAPTSAHRKQTHEAHQARIEQQKELWTNTLTATETIECGMLPHGDSVRDDVVGYFTGPDEEISEIADRIGGQKFRPRPGVLIWINNFG
jgi:hypothetical protein